MSTATGSGRRARGYFPVWKLKTSGVIMPEQRLAWGQTVVSGLQHCVAMSGSTIIAPLLMGFDPNVAVLFSGVGTLIFFVIVAGRVPSYLGSRFPFIADVPSAPRHARDRADPEPSGLPRGLVRGRGLVGLHSPVLVLSCV